MSLNVCLSVCHCCLAFRIVVECLSSCLWLVSVVECRADTQLKKASVIDVVYVDYRTKEYM